MAIITAMVGIPLILVSGYAMDINNAVSKKSHISAALDTAALASVIPDNLDDEQRAAYAQEVFDKNYLGDVPATLNINATRERVDIFAEANVPTYFGSIVGMDDVTVTEKSAAVLTKSDVVCVLALDPTGERAIEFQDQAVYSSPACSVQVNSTNNLAMVSDVITPPVAKSFCVGGISRGDFNPYIKHACSPVADPYVDLSPPADSWCIPPRLVSGYLGLFQSDSGTEDTFGNNAVLIPGTYCKGLRVKGVNITFLPGTYIIKGGQFEISKGSQVTGQDVTFVLKGDKASLEVKSDAQVNFKAPNTGNYAGMVFFQVPELPEIGKKPKFPTGTSYVRSGGGLNIVGTAYFRSQELEITSESPVASQSPATSFIAYRLKFGGKSNAQVRVDHEAGGIPPLLPRSDESARLVSTDRPQ